MPPSRAIFLKILLSSSSVLKRFFPQLIRGGGASGRGVSSCFFETRFSCVGQETVFRRNTG